MNSIGRTAVIVLNWNAIRETLKTIEMVERWGIPLVDVIVVDNASEADQQNSLRSIESKAVKVVFNEKNLGFAGGSNKGIQLACSSGYETILLLNNDAEIGVESIKQLYETLLNNPDVGVVGPVIYDSRYEHVLNAGGLDIATNDITHLKTPIHDTKPYQVDYISGTVFLARTSLFTKFGVLDEDYFFSGEIADFCYRIESHCMVNPKACASHDTDRSKVNRGKLYTYYTVRNRYIYIRKNLKDLKWKYYPRWWKVHAKHAWTTLKSGKYRESIMVIRGLTDGMIGKKGILV